MQQGTPSGTAHRVALRRAAHQVADTPLVFNDPLALRLLGFDATGSRQRHASTMLRAPNRPGSRSQRAYLVARSRFAEDTLHNAVNDGMRQYVLLGAGLDTFAYRNSYPQLAVFEVDEPVAQHQKQTLLEQAGIDAPSNVVFVPTNFERDSLEERLRTGGYNASEPAVFAWLGVVPYLSRRALDQTMVTLSASAAGSLLVLDDNLPRHALPPVEQLEFDSLAARVAATGEPFRTWFTPGEMHTWLAAHGWQVLQHLDRVGMNGRYFAGRADGLAVLRNGACLLQARRSG